MTTLRHQLLDATQHPIAGRTAAVSFYPGGADVIAGTYQRSRPVYATSGDDGWLTWELPTPPATVTGTPSYVVTGVEANPILIAVPRTVSTALLGVVRYGSLPAPAHPDMVDLVTEDELAARIAAAFDGASSVPTTDTQREQYVPGRLSAASLKAAFDARLAVAAVATANKTAALDTYQPVNAAGGAVTITLPTGSPQGSVIVVEKEDASANVVTLSGSIRGTVGATMSLVWQYESLTLTAGATGSWWPRAGHKTKATLDAAYGGLGTANAWSGTQTFNGGAKAATLGIGNGASGLLRQPNNSNVLIDGSTLSATGASGIDKVGSVNAVTFRGGFSNEASYGSSNPSFLWGANDFVTTGTASGDVAGITEFWGRLTETHLNVPGASISDQYGLVGQTNVDSAATGATISGWLASIRATPPSVTATGTTIANAASIYSPGPAAGIATNTYNIYAGGTVQNYFGGQTVHNSGMIVSGTAGSAVFRSFTPNVQGTAAGVYLGSGGGPAVELSDGTNNVRLDNSSGTFRVLKAGVSVLFTVDSSGNAAITGGLSFSPATTATAPTAGGAGALPATPAGYMTVTVGGTARKVAYY